jgi:protein ImuB
MLTQLGLRTWGDVQALPRAPLVRRMGAGLRTALDVAWGQAPESYPWLTAPERFAQKLELPTRVDAAPALLWAARRLLVALSLWLRARQQGVLAIELGWTLELKRLNGRTLPPGQTLTVRTAQPTQSIDHLLRLLSERLAHTPMLAPATDLFLHALDTQPWESPSISLLPDTQTNGEPLHVFVERVSARLGVGSVRQPAPHADHRPEQQQTWQAAPTARTSRTTSPIPGWPDALAPTWLLRPPHTLAVRAGQPCHEGAPLRLLTRARRIEAGWWGDALPSHTGQAAARDYFIAQGARQQLLWVYRERPCSAQPAHTTPRWFLHGLYA